MKFLFLSFVLFLGFTCNVSAQNVQIEKVLSELPGVTFKELETKGNFEKGYELKIKQPLDHQNPEKGYFYQRVFLSHKGFDKPMVMYISGYSQHRAYETELSKLLGGNQLSIEHRFFGTSVPDTLDYSYLNIEQATADLHHINQLFKRIYKNKWVSTGISKGGATTIFYKYFYPEDVDAGVPYVAPINTGFEEKRLTAFLDTIGSDECREKILSFQKRIFRQREMVLPLLKKFCNDAGLSFKYLGFEGAFEYSVLEYPFAFWQYGSSCEEIPCDTASLQDAVDYLMKVSSMKLFSDRDIDYFLPHYYQSATQLGYYGYDTENFKDDLKVLPVYPHPHAALVPKHIPVKFDGSVLNKVNRWLQTDGNQLMYIYGATDTWTAAAVPPSKNVDAVWFFMKGKDHGSARYSNMTDEDKALFVSTLERWLGVDLKQDY